MKYSGRITMNGMRPLILPDIHPINGQHDRLISNGDGDGRCQKSRVIVVRPSISRGRGYAVVLVREAIDENEECLLIQPAPKTAKLVRTGRFDAYPPHVASISDLSDPLITRILSYINDAKTIFQMGTICKQWRRVVCATYKKNTDDGNTWNRLPYPILTNLFLTTKLKIFGKSKWSSYNIETNCQKKDSGCYREVVVRIDSTGPENRLLIDYLYRLAAFLTIKQSILLVDIDLNDQLIKFLFEIWQPKVAELRLFRCSFEKYTTIGLNIFLNEASRLKHLYVDNCPLSTSCVLARNTNLSDLCKLMTRFELCFTGRDCAASKLIDDKFLDTIVDGWKFKVDIRYLKIANAPLITTEGVENLLKRYFKLRYGGTRRDEYDKKRDFGKVPNLILWFCETSFDVDVFLNGYPGKKYFREDKLYTSKRRKIRDSYSGEDTLLWIEK